MNFDRTEEQELVAASIARFIEREYSFEARRRIVSSPGGYSDDIWRGMADLGLLGLLVPDDLGGLGGGAMEAMPLMEAIGSALVVEPWLATAGIGARLIARAGSAEHRALLARVSDGTLKLAFAHPEPDAPEIANELTMRAQRHGSDLVITGTVRAVPHACAADHLIVTLRESAPDAMSLVLVPRDTPGMHLRELRMLDGTRAADLTLREVRIPTDAIIGASGGAAPIVAEVLDFATALVCAEAVGAIDSANAATLEYLKTREQFGVAIGSFQALQHRMVDMVIEAEQARSMASLACSTVDNEQDGLRRAHVVSAAKARIGEACRLVSQESIQLHGGMGMSDELKVSHTFRRLTAIRQQFGTVDYHLERFAATATARDR